MGAWFGVTGITAVAGWIAGLAWQMRLDGLPPPSHAWAFVAVGTLLVLLAAGLLTGQRSPGDPAATASGADRGGLPAARLGLGLGLAAAAAAALAFGSTSLRAVERVQQVLASDLEGRDLRVQGVVSGLPQRTAHGLRFTFDVEAAWLGDDPVTLPPRLLLGWYSGFHEDAVRTGPQQALKGGQRWTFKLRLRRPHGPLNPHGFDFERYLFERGIGATGHVREAPAQRVLAADGNHVLRWRQAMRDAIERRLGDTRAAGVLAALALGDQSAIERDDWDLFRTTGVAHLMSISGLHVTMFAWLAGLGVAALWRRVPRLMLAMPVPRAAGLLGWGAAALYAVFAGWGVPAQRTVWMLAVVTLLAASGRRWPWTMVLAAAAAVVTITDPWAVGDAGFWLSFVAVALLMASAPWASDSTSQRWAEQALGAREASAQPLGAAAGAFGHALRGAVRTQLVATVGLAPLTLLLFQQVSLVGLVANLVAVPAITLVVTPLALLGALLAPLWSLAAVAVEALGGLLGWLATWPGAVLEAAVAPGWIQLAALLGGVLAILPWPWRWRLLALPLMAPMLLVPVPRPEAGRFEVVALDVGQGTAVLVRTRHHLLVYDAGPQYSRDSDAGERILLPLLRARGERRIDRLMLSHRDLDHVGGAAALLRFGRVATLSSSLEAGHALLADAARRGIPHEPCRAGQSWTWDGVRFDVLHPATAEPADTGRPNARSCVLRVAEVQAGVDGARPASVLLTGDIEREQELALVARAAPELASDVLLAPHHGSRTSSSPEFLEVVAPRVAVIQAGYRSRFAHPSPVVLGRLRERGVSVAASAGCGAWQWSSDAADPRGLCRRAQVRRYWHHPGDGPHELP